MALKTGISSINVALSQGKGVKPFSNRLTVGKVYGSVTTENTPTKEKFEKAGGFDGIGTVFYKNYQVSKNDIEQITDESIHPALPLFPQFQYIPLVGELIYILDLPSPISRIDNNGGGQKYYITINLWNNVQQNASPASDSTALGIDFIQNPNIRPLLPYQGDTIIQGRQGNSLRFSTTSFSSPKNEWSQTGKEYDPITILSNGLAYNPDQQYYVEQINKDASSIYLTSTQKIPLQTDKKGVLNNLTNPLNVPDYFNSQLILNSDRVVINSKRDEVMLFAKTNIELNTKNTINLNADERIHLNSNAIFLGPYDSTHTPQPLVLGNQLYTVLSDILDSLHTLGTSLSSVIGSPEGAPAVDINMAAEDLLNSVEKISDNLEGILSQQNFTV